MERRMEFFCERRETLKPKGALFLKLRAAAALACVLASTMPSWALGLPQAQQQPTAPAPAPTNIPTNTDSAVQGLPPEPAPNYTQPLFLRPTVRDYTQPRGYWPN